MKRYGIDISSHQGNIDFNVLKIVYNTTFFILCQFKRLFRIPNSIEKIHKETVETITKLDEQCGKFLSLIEINNFINSQNLNDNDSHTHYLL